MKPNYEYLLLALSIVSYVIYFLAGLYYSRLRLGKRRIEQALENERIRHSMTGSQDYRWASSYCDQLLDIATKANSSTRPVIIAVFILGLYTLACYVFDLQVGRSVSVNSMIVGIIYVSLIRWLVVDILKIVRTYTLDYR